MRKTTIVIADDHPIMRDGIKMVLESDQKNLVIGETSGFAETVKVCHEKKPDVLVLDYSMGNGDCLDAISRIQKSGASPKIVILTVHDSTDYAIRAMRAGAAAFVVKRSGPGELLKAVENAMSGKSYFSPEIVESLGERLQREAERDPVSALSEREWQTMTRIASGRTVKEIAAELHISASSVQTYRRRLMHKLGLRSNIDIARFALARGLVEQ